MPTASPTGWRSTRWSRHAPLAACSADRLPRGAARRPGVSRRPHRHLAGTDQPRGLDRGGGGLRTRPVDEPPLGPDRRAATAVVGRPGGGGALVGWTGAASIGTASFGQLDALVALVVVAAALPATLAPRRPTGPAVARRCRWYRPGGYVLQGGASRWLNHHHGHPQQNWAVDLSRCPGPGGVTRYPSGRGGRPGCRHRRRGRRRLPGPGRRRRRTYVNHVVILSRTQTRLFLCHLAERSVAVAEGQAVSPGDCWTGRQLGPLHRTPPPPARGWTGRDRPPTAHRGQAPVTRPTPGGRNR